MIATRWLGMAAGACWLLGGPAWAQKVEDQVNEMRSDIDPGAADGTKGVSNQGRSTAEDEKAEGDAAAHKADGAKTTTEKTGDETHAKAKPHRASTHHKAHQTKTAPDTGSP